MSAISEDLSTLLVACMSACLLCVAANAQNATIPTDFEQSDGDSKNWVWSNTPSRMLANYAPHVTGLKGGNRILALYLRTDDVKPGQSVFGPHKNVTVATRLSSGGLPGRSVSGLKWKDYEGTNKGAWSKKVVMNLPGSSSASPEPWIRLPHVVPHVVASDGSLAVDVKFWTAKTESLGDALDAQKVMNLGKFIRRGSGCPKSLEVIGSSWHYGATYASYSVPATVSGKHAQGDVVVAWLDARLIDHPLGFKYGTAPCSLYVLPVVIHPVPRLVSGPKPYAGFAWRADSIFSNPAVKGVKVFAQHAAVTRNNQIQLTNGLSITIGWGWSKGWTGVYTVEGYNYNNSPKIYNPDVDPPIWGSSYAPIFGVIKA